MPGSRFAIRSPTALLMILGLINFLNYVDRTVISGLVPYLQDPKDGLGLSSSEIGLVQGAFMVVHSMASIPLGLLADRYLRTRIVAIGVTVWSLATAAAGMAANFLQIFVARAAVGIGEASYAPAATSLISDRFKPEQRARALGAFQLGTVLGGGLGVMVGGLVASHWSWRAAFYVVGLPGLVLALAALLVHEPERAPAKRSTTVSMAIPVGAPYSISAVIWITMAGIGTTFFTGALVTWGPKFVLRVLYHGDKSQMGHVVGVFGPILGVGSLLGILAGSFIADRLEAWRPGAGRLLTVAISVFGAAPCAVIAFLAHEAWLLYAMLFCGALFAVMYAGPILAALHDVVPLELRATVTGAYFFAIHALGDAVSPWIVGRIDDATHSLRTGLLVATGALALAGVAALLALPGSRRVAELKIGRAAS